MSCIHHSMHVVMHLVLLHSASSVSRLGGGASKPDAFHHTFTLVSVTLLSGEPQHCRK